MDQRNQFIKDWMGKTVRVIVDRPIGYRHGDVVYPVNYGYIPGVMAADGEEQDAYILGVAESLEAFEGQVIGAIRRKNDCEDKLVVAPAGTLLHQGQIAQAVHFQEQYFDTTVDSLLRKSCGVIPMRRVGKRTEYLILKQTNHCWSFPKGHMDAGETEEQTALRELKEETGLSAKLFLEKKITLEYPIKPFSRKQVELFLGEVYGDITVQPNEIVDYRWVTADHLGKFLHPDTCKAFMTVFPLSESKITKENLE